MTAAELPPGHTAVLDGRFPIDTSHQHEPIYAQLLAEWWQHDAKFVADERARTAYQAGVQAAVAAHGGERRYIAAPEPDTFTLRVIEPDAEWEMPHREGGWYRQAQEELAEPELEVAHETAVRAEVAVWHQPEPERPHWWSRLSQPHWWTP